MSPLPHRVFKVLSIDGGGIKGLYMAAMLRQLDMAMRDRYRGPVTE